MARRVSNFRALINAIKKSQKERELINREAQKERELFYKEVALAVKIKIREEENIEMHGKLIEFLSKVFKENGIGIKVKDIEEIF